MKTIVILCRSVFHKIISVPVLTLVLFLMASGTSAQWISGTHEEEFGVKYYPFGISLSADWYPFYSHSPLQTGDLSFRSHMMWGFSAGLAYHWIWNNRWSMKFRLKMERMPLYQYTLFIPAQETQDGKDYYKRVSAYAPFSFHLPVTVEFRSYAVPRYIFFVQGGIDLGFQNGFIKTGLHPPYLTTTFSGTRIWQWYPRLVIGWYYPFSWVLWETGFVFRYAPQTYYQGEYLIRNLSSTSGFTGYLTQSGQYIGLEFTWYFKRPYITDDVACAGQVHSKKVLKRKRAEEKARRQAQKMEEKARKKEMKRNKRLARERNKRLKKRKKKKFLIF